MKKNKLIIAIISFMAIFVIIIGAFLLKNNESKNVTNFKTTTENQNVIVSVNGENIYNYEIDRVFEQYQDTNSISKEKIIENTIDEILVIQKGKDDYGIDVSDSEVKALIDDYKLNFPEQYSKALEIYGEESFFKGQKDRQYYNKTKEYVLKNILKIENGISKEQIKNFEQHYGIEESLKNYSDSEVLSQFQSDIENYIFNEWVKSLRDDAAIEYYEE